MERIIQQLGATAPEDASQWLGRLRDTLNGCTARPDDATAVAIVRSLPSEVRRAA